MVTDCESAWIELGQLIAAKSQHGRAELLQRMAEIAARCRIPESELSRHLRLYGIEVERARPVTIETEPAGEASSGQDSVLAGTAASGHIIDRGGHDGSSNGARGGH